MHGMVPYSAWSFQGLRRAVAVAGLLGAHAGPRLCSSTVPSSNVVPVWAVFSSPKKKRGPKHKGTTLEPLSTLETACGFELLSHAVQNCYTPLN